VGLLGVKKETAYDIFIRLKQEIVKMLSDPKEGCNESEASMSPKSSATDVAEGHYNGYPLRD
jgi:hypothetical protein